MRVLMMILSIILSIFANHFFFNIVSVIVTTLYWRVKVVILYPGKNYTLNLAFVDWSLDYL